MIRWVTAAILAAVVCAGCSGKDFKSEILGEAPPASEAPSTPAPAPPLARAEPPASYPLSQPAPQPAVQHAAQPVAQASPAAGETLVFQVGSFAHRDNAQSLTDMLSGRGYPSRIEEAQVGGKAYYRVVAEAPGPESGAVSALASLGVSEPRLLSRRGSGYAPAPAPAAPVPAPAAPVSAPAQAASAPPPAAAAPVAPAAPGQPAYAAKSAGGVYPPYCLIDATRIEAVGKSAGKSAEALMARKEAAQDAKRNLLVCIDAFKNKGRAVSKSYRVEAYLPDNLVVMGAPVFQADGSVAVRASIGVADVDSVTINRIE